MTLKVLLNILGGKSQELKMGEGDYFRELLFYHEFYPTSILKGRDKCV